MTAQSVTQWLEGHQVPLEFAQLGGWAFAILYLLVFALLANFLAKRLIAYIIHPVIKKTSTEWDDLLISNGVFVRLSHIVPAIAIQVFSPLLLGSGDNMTKVIDLAVNLYLIIIALYVIDGGLNFMRALWERGPLGKRFPAKSFTQAFKLVVNLIGIIFILSVLFDESPLVLFSGLGAVTAILLLIFKDAILGLVAGFQLSVNNMVMVGDWIAMPARGADGDVIDVSLTTVKVQNWDKTITTIPTYALISDSFKNWRGMSEAGGRRIKRALNIDMRTIQFANEELLERFKRIRLLRSYLDAKLEEIQKYNADVGDDLAELINGRRLTNIGTFRAYCLAYLRNHPKVRQDLTLLVRQLAPEEHGLPIEIYVFSNDIAWANYEAIQADIFDHFLSVLPEFNLSSYQAPSGADLEKAAAAFKS
ncbi:mechanosensitive ion channel protein MscS [Coraliomargarita sinensis]|uniref:Mechanosensing system component YbdG n=1 Tax=Coraliomargarita sinensis TaxID=2174842 RepID=A0A317ZG34_9BACT|nr:mechanosensitive ion channel domain-containing protein [Coraliomargarita sinensis]PXA03307.1 mechanosensitive ion channel protein MscS [Coraliomargarita sinensis]